jgi:hypothetical protein
LGVSVRSARARLEQPKRSQLLAELCSVDAVRLGVAWPTAAVPLGLAGVARWEVRAGLPVVADTAAASLGWVVHVGSRETTKYPDAFRHQGERIRAQPSESRQARRRGACGSVRVSGGGGYQGWKTTLAQAWWLPRGGVDTGRQAVSVLRGRVLTAGGARSATAAHLAPLDWLLPRCDLIRDWAVTGGGT